MDKIVTFLFDGGGGRGALKGGYGDHFWFLYESFLIFEQSFKTGKLTVTTREDTSTAEKERPRYTHYWHVVELCKRTSLNIQERKRRSCLRSFITKSIHTLETLFIT